MTADSSGSSSGSGSGSLPMLLCFCKTLSVFCFHSFGLNLYENPFPPGKTHNFDLPFCFSFPGGNVHMAFGKFTNLSA